MAPTKALEELPKELNNENDNSNQQKQKNRRHKLLLELLLDFARNTTLHGPRYITERGLSVVEKMFWMVISVTSLCLCILLMWKVWVKWETSPVIISLSEQLGSVSEIPFPAVTICPEAKIRQNWYNYTKYKIDLQIFTREVLNQLPESSHEEAIKNLTNENRFMLPLYAMELVCSKDNDLYDLPREFADYSDLVSIQEAAPTLYDTLSYGVFQSLIFSAKTQYLDQFLTNEGVCFTFNSLHAREILDRIDRVQYKFEYSDMEPYLSSNGWTLQDGYSSPIPSRGDYPFRGRAKRGDPDLAVYLKEVKHRDILCDGLNKAFKVYLHHPADLPQSSLYYYAVLPEEVASFAIKPIVMKTADTLADYPPHIRQCYYPGERDLRYFKLYTPNNCQLECVTNYTLEYCGCVWFHMPRNGEVKICSIQKYSCVVIALEELSKRDANKTSVCDCMPLCYSVQYEADVLKTPYNANVYYDNLNRIKKIVDNQSEVEDAKNKKKKLRLTKLKFNESNTKIEMYFKEPQFRAMLRSELFGLTDFLANCGGLLSLCLGFSFLSLIEIFYFLTLRLGCRLRRNNKAEENEKDNDNHFKIV